MNVPGNTDEYLLSRNSKTQMRNNLAVTYYRHVAVKKGSCAWLQKLSLMNTEVSKGERDKVRVIIFRLVNVL